MSSAARALVREPHTPPKHPTDPLRLPRSIRHIQFFHPGYPKDDALLLSLPALDHNGIHHRTALDACAIVANNRWDGFFSLDREGQDRVSTENMDQLLNAAEYYFQVPKRDADDYVANIYPIIPTFSEWRFPHADVPERWVQDPDRNAALPNRCCLSKAMSLLETAHIIPNNTTDQIWFDENGMSRYGDINSMANTLRLKVDVHQYFDRKPKFAIVPKHGEMVAHVFNDQTAEAAEAIELYHNVPLPLDGQNYRFLLARLAWTVFPCLGGFLKKRVPRRLIRRQGLEFVEVEVSGEECYRHYVVLSKSRSLSPSKRTARQMEGMDDVQENNAITSDHEDSDDWTWEHRGRKRRRSFMINNQLSSHSSGSQDYMRSGSEASESVDDANLARL